MSDKWISPRTVLQNINGDLEAYAYELVENGSLPRLFVSFLRYDRRIQPSVLTTADWSIQIKMDDQGLLGAAIEERATKIWDIHNPSAEDALFIKGDPRTVFEIVFPVLHQGKVTGVGMVDFFDGELGRNPEELFVDASDWQNKISSIVSSPASLEDSLNQRLVHYVGDCVKATGSLRGYVAFAHWSGSPIYIAEGQDHDKFLPLSLDVGMVGEAYHRGEIINEGNVWRRPGYIPSDDRIASELVIPIKIHGRVVGVLNLEATTENHYSDALVRSALAFEDKIRSVSMDLLAPTESQDDEKLAIFGRHIQKTLKPSKLNLPNLKRDQLLEKSLENLRLSLESFAEVAYAKIFWTDGKKKSDEKRYSDQVLEQITTSSKPFITFEGKLKSILFGVKVSEQLVAVLEVELNDIHGPTIIDSAKLLVNVSISEIERRIENQRRFAIEPFLEKIVSLRTLEDALFFLPIFLGEYFDCDEVLVLSGHKLERDWVFQVQSAYPVTPKANKFPFSQTLSDSGSENERQAVLAHCIENDLTIISQRPRYSGRSKIGSNINSAAGPSWSIEHDSVRSILVFSLTSNKTSCKRFVLRLSRSTDVGGAPFNKHDIEKIEMIKGILEKMFSSS